MEKVLIICALLALDQITKLLVVIKLDENESITIIPKALKFTSIRNRGAFCGILSGQKSLFMIISIVLVTIFGYILGIKGNFYEVPLLTLALIFIISGTLGNIFDRIIRGEVVDFIEIFHGLPIFNLADLYLFMGLVSLLVSEII